MRVKVDERTKGDLYIDYKGCHNMDATIRVT